LFFAGFCCDDYSTLNKNWTSAQGCIDRNEGKSGQTAVSTMKYFRQHRPLFFFLENVKMIAMGKNGTQSDLEVVIQELRSMGYIVDALLLGATSYGCPQSRERYYIYGVLGREEPDEEEVEEEHEQEEKHEQEAETEEQKANKKQKNEKFPDWWTDIKVQMEKLQMPPWDLQRWLLADDDDEVDAWRDYRIEVLHKQEAAMEKKEEGGSAGKKNKKSKTDQDKPKDKMEFHVDHLQAYEAAGLHWPPVTTEDFEDKAGHLPRRSKEIAWYLEQVFPVDKYPTESLHDLHLNMKWQKGLESELNTWCPCLTGSSRPWLRVAGRDLTGSEALALQGVDYEFQKPQRNGQMFTNPQRLDLAGNAFNAFCVLPLLLASFACIDWSVPFAHRKQWLLASGSEASGAENSESESCLFSDED
jgi:site-specific DNA-cytosine methylase